MCEKGVNFIHIGLIKGVFFHPGLALGIQHICQSIYHHLHNIRRIRKYLSYDNRKSIVQAIIMSWLDYCNGLLYGTPAVHLKLGKLQRLQNSAARLVCTVSRYDHITPTLINLHWLPVTHTIEIKIAMLVHKSISSVSPQYLLDLIKIKASSQYQLRSYRAYMLPIGGFIVTSLFTKTPKDLWAWVAKIKAAECFVYARGES